MKMNSLKPFRTEGFSSEDQGVASQMSSILNPIITQLNILLNKSVDFINLNRQLKQLTLTVDASGRPVNALQFQSELKTKCVSIQCARAINTRSNTTYLPYCPIVNFSESDKTIIIDNIGGLAPNIPYDLTFILEGDNVS